MAGKGAKGRLGLSLCSDHYRMAVLLSYEWGDVEVTKLNPGQRLG